MALKVDIRKAFDTLDWEFLIMVLSQFGLCDIFGYSEISKVVYSGKWESGGFFLLCVWCLLG